MPAYTVAAAALALNVDRKWLDNILSHHTVPHVAHATRGVARKLAPAAVDVLAITLTLHRELQVPVARALDVAQTLLERGSASLTAEITLSANIPAIREIVGKATRRAMEVAPSIRRGRPRGSAGKYRGRERAGAVTG